MAHVLGLEHECSRKTHPTTQPGLWRQSLGLKPRTGHSCPQPQPPCFLAVGPPLPSPAYSLCPDAPLDPPAQAPLRHQQRLSGGAWSPHCCSK